PMFSTLVMLAKCRKLARKGGLKPGRRLWKRNDSVSMKPFAAPEMLASVALGWFKLKDHPDADAELERITLRFDANPDMALVRWQTLARARKWNACLDLSRTIISLAPQRLIARLNLAYALIELKRHREALDQLLPLVDEFPGEWSVPFN